MNSRFLLVNCMIVLIVASWSVGQPFQSSPSLQNSPKTGANAPVSTPDRKGPATNSLDSYSVIAGAYKRAREQAHLRGDHKAEAAAALNEARAYELLDTPASSVEVENAYRIAITAARAAGDAKQQSLAANNLAVMFIKQRRLADAQQALAEVDIESASLAEQIAFRFNIARVLELQGQPNKAYAKYYEITSSDPGFVPALEGAFRTITTQPEPFIKKASVLSDRALASGHNDLAHAQLLRLLQLWGKQADAQRLLAGLLRTYTSEEMIPEVFQKTELPKLRQIGTLHRNLGLAITQVRAVFLGELPLNVHALADVFANWGGEMGDAYIQTALAEELKQVAKYYADHEETKMALGRYGAAWILTREPQYAMEYSSLLSRSPSLDPGNALIDQLLDSMFAVKGKYYSIEDWPNILRMHVALGTIFEQQNKWGNSSDARSAIFQWEHAIMADSKARSQNPEFIPSPGLHAHLANAYAAVRRYDDSKKEFWAAQKDYAALGDRAQAMYALERASELTRGAESPKLARDLQPGIYKYRTTLVFRGKTTVLNSSTTIEWGREGWTATNLTETPMGPAKDTAILEKGSLIVRKRSLWQGRETISLDFTDNKASGMMSIDGQNRPISVDLGGPLFGDAAGSDEAIASLPLAEGYITTFRNFDVRRQKEKLMLLKVAGVEKVTVAAGTFDAYKVELASNDEQSEQKTLWISKDSHKPVKISFVLPSLEGATLVTELLP
jgi:tetratricopeptide (TPR) repeat protein